MKGFLETREVVRRMVGKRIEGHELKARHMAYLLGISEQAIRAHLKSLSVRARGTNGKTNGSGARQGKVRG